jgi:hypothetical protein
MTILDERHTVSHQTPEEPEVLFREARRRRHRRWAVGAVVFITAALPVGTLVHLANAPSHRSISPRAHVHAKPTVPTAPSTEVQPKQPGALAIAPNGTLYIADGGRNQILARTPSGHFRVIAGNGRVGFSGDGGPAVDAELDGPQGIAVSPNGTIYFADAYRIREVTPNGIINTIAGNGQQLDSLASPPTTGPATQVAIGNTAAVALGPDGTVYFTGFNQVLQLSADGTLTVVADTATFTDFDPALAQDNQCEPISLAFDGAGDLYIGCSDPFVLLERTPDGSLHYVGALRPHDAVGAITDVPGGGMLALEGASVASYGSAAPRPDNDFLSYRLPGNADFWPQGIAVSADGTVYLSQDGQAGIGPPAIVEQSSSGNVSVLWGPGPP